MGYKSRRTRERHVRICERLGVRLPGPTRPGVLYSRNMRTRVLSLFLLIAASVSSWSQTQTWATVIFSGIPDAGGTQLPPGTICLAPVSQLTGLSMNFQAPGVRQIENTPVCLPVMSGNITPHQFVNTQITWPANMCYRLSATDVTGKAVIRPPNPQAKNGYHCVQMNFTWCSVVSGVYTCDLAKYRPNMAAQAQVMAPTLSAGAFTSLPPGSQPSCAVNGNSENYTLSCGLPQGNQGVQGPPETTKATGVNGDFNVPGQLQAGTVAESTVSASVNGQINVMGPPYNAKGDCSTHDSGAFTAAQADGFTYHKSIFVPTPPGGCYVASFTFRGASMIGQQSGYSLGYGGQNVIIKGEPGKDVLNVLDPTTNNFGFNDSWTIEHITFDVDDSLAGSFPHRWPGRWGDGGSITAGTNIYTPGNEGAACGDVGQAIRIGSNPPTTITEVNNCNGGYGTATITLAANQTTGYSRNAHTYISVAGIPATTNLGPCGMAFDDKDGYTANWTNANHNLYNSYDHLHNVVFTSTSNANNSCAFYAQGQWVPYGIDAREFTMRRQPFGVVEASPELNSYYIGAGNDFQTWDHGSLEGMTYPWIMYGGAYGSIKDVEVTASNGPQVLSNIGNRWADGSAYWSVQFKEMEGGSGSWGFRFGLSDSTITDSGVTIGNLSTIWEGSHDNCITCTFGSSAAMQLYGAHNDIKGHFIPSSGGVTDNGTGNRVSNVSPYAGAASPASGFTANPNTKRNELLGTWTADFLRSGNTAHPYPNDDDLLLRPQDAILNASNCPSGYSNCVVSDRNPVSGKALVWNAGFSVGAWWQFLSDGSRNNPIIGKSIPASKVTVSWSAYCPSATRYNMTIQTGGTGGAVIYTVNPTCSTTPQIHSVGLDLSGWTAGNNNLYFTNNGGGIAYLQWIGIAPYVNTQEVNGGAIPASANVLGTNSNEQPVSASSSAIQAAIGSSVYDASGAAAARASVETSSGGQFLKSTSTSGSGDCASPSATTHVRTVNDTVYTGTTDPGTILSYTTPNDGKRHQYKLQFWEIVTATSSSGGNTFAQWGAWTYNGTSFASTRILKNIATTTLNASSLTTLIPGAEEIVADPNTSLQVYIVLNGVTSGTPTIHYAAQLFDNGPVQ